MRALYITHYGILEPLGQSQILPYLRGLAQKGRRIEILSFEKPELLKNGAAVRRQEENLSFSNIRWYPRPYQHGSTTRNLVGDLWRTAWEIVSRCRLQEIDLIHARSHVPAIMALPASVLLRIPLIFDFRGFLAEEYVDAGIWKKNGLKFRAAKSMEKLLLTRCKALVVLTQTVRRFFIEVQQLPPEKISVIPCCTDLSSFSAKTMTQSPLTPRPIRVLYSGSLFGRYDIEAMIDFFKLARRRRPGSTFTVLCNREKDRLEKLLREMNTADGSVIVRSVAPAEVPESLKEHDLGLIFLRGDLALQAASATKTAEYLASGMVVVAESRLGDLEEILANQKVGCLVDSANRDSYSTVLDQALQLCDSPGIRERAAATARRYYDLEEAVRRYDSVYRHVVS